MQRCATTSARITSSVRMPCVATAYRAVKRRREHQLRNRHGPHLPPDSPPLRPWHRPAAHPEWPNEDHRIATLYKARTWLPADRWEQLVTMTQKSPHSAQGEQKIRQMRYDYGLEQLVSASNAKEYGKATGLLAVLAPEIEARKDAATALLGAWSHYQLQQYDAAAGWFERALAWNAASDDARRGLALCAYQQKRYDA